MSLIMTDASPRFVTPRPIVRKCRVCDTPTPRARWLRIEGRPDCLCPSCSGWHRVMTWIARRVRVARVTAQ